MEDTHWVRLYDRYDKYFVLILVLMEDTHWETATY